MIRLIAHRALFNGPNPTLENHPEQILDAVMQGFDAEVDVWLVDGQWWLGHDRPTYETSMKFLERRGLWLHAKNHEALHALAREQGLTGLLNFFWHDSDAYTLTSRGIVWAYPGQPLSDKAVWVQPEWDPEWRSKLAGVTCYAICSKHVAEIRGDCYV